MKNRLKVIGLFTFLCIYVLDVKSQDLYQKHEVRINFSDAIPLTIGDAFVEGFSSGFAASITGYSKKSFNEKNSGMWGLGYKYHFNNRLNVGVDIGLLTASKDTELSKTNDTYTVHRKTNFFLVMPTIQYSYLNKEIIQLYGNLGTGLLSYSVKENKDDGTNYSDNYTSFAFQLNPIGIRVGKQFAGYAELGFGFKGIINVGASYKF